MPRLVATDLDGTLVRSDRSVSARTRRALALVEARGGTVVFVSARPPRWMDELAELVGAHGLAVCANGGFVYDIAERAIVAQHPLTDEIVTEVVDLLRDELPGLAFAVESSRGFGHEPGYWTSYPVPEGSPVGDLADLLQEPVVKVLARHRDLDVDELHARAHAVAGDLVEISHSGAPGLVEIAARGVSKASGLAALCAQLEVAAPEVVAFGDMPNDIPMLTWAGTSYAVGNAHPKVRECVTHLAPSNDEDGVATVLERIFG